MWNEEEGFYFDLLPDGRMLSVWTPAGFIPLLAGIPDEMKYQRLREHLLDPKKFWSTYPLPTLSIDDEHFMVNNWWRGCTWPVINWQVNEGLFQYDPDIALQLLMKTVDMMICGGSPTCSEYYNPFDGRAGGAMDQGWGAMPVDLLLHHVFGLNPRPDHLELTPCFPADWNEASVRNIFTVGTSVEVCYQRSDADLLAIVKNVGGRNITIVANSQTLTLKPGEEGTMKILKP
jgi:glycogen debranching enzyme